MKLVEPLSEMSQAEAWLESLGASTMKLGLDRIERLLKMLGNPHEGYPLVHIAGTNGKGSVLAMLASVLKAAGYKTGTYTSPHLLHVRERIAVDGAPILPDDFVAGVETIRQAVQQLDWAENDHPTYFEVLNVLAFLHFKKLYTQGDLDMVLLETGLGGRLDSTNVVKQPSLCVITGIAEDHTEHLGTTLAQIAGEKAGIIKPGVPVVLGPNLVSQAKLVITDVALKADAPVTEASVEGLQISARSNPADGLLVDNTANKQQYRLSLMAPYQVNNLATVLAVLSKLRQQNYMFPDVAIAEGLSHTRWPARFQYMAKQRIVLDASHNAEGFVSLADALLFYFPGRPLYWLLSLRNNRDQNLLQQLLTVFGKQTQGVIFTAAQPQSIYHLPATLAADTKKTAPAFCVVSTADEPEQALMQLQQQLKSNPEAIGVVTGSLYTAGNLLQRLS